MDQEDLLDTLLTATANELEKLAETSFNNVNQVTKEATHSRTIVKEVDIFHSEEVPEEINGKQSVIHDGDSDSSDEEDRRYFEEQKYNEYGREIKALIKSESYRKDVSPTTNTNSLKPKGLNQCSTSDNKSVDIYIDPIFHMRIIKPLVSNTLLIEKMEGREAVSFSNLSLLITSDRLKNKDWVICGVIIAKSPPKTSQKGHQFSIWTLTDLKDDIKTVSLFMFGNAHKNLWKTAIGTVVAILNPNIMERRDGFKEVASLNVDTAQKVLIFGHSKDYGTCKSMKKNGDKCTTIVNLSRCEYCIYHIRQEYQACSKRSELQANFAGRGLTNLRNKVLGKNEVFYAGKSYTAIPAKKSKKLEARDNDILSNLSGKSTLTSGKSKQKSIGSKGTARQFDVKPAQRARDLELLKKLGGVDNLENKTTFSGTRSDNPTLEESKTTALSVINKLKSQKANTDRNKTDAKSLPENIDQKKENGSNKFNEKQSEKCLSSVENLSGTSSSFLKVQTCTTIPSDVSRTTATNMGIPKLSGFGKSNAIIDLNAPVNSMHINRAKINAIKYVQTNGPIKKSDPNSTKKSPTNRKRNIDAILDGDTTNSDSQNLAKKPNTVLISDRFKRIMAATSRHSELLEQHDNEQKEKYFNMLETKEKMEEKMTSTYKMKCKAVKCLICKYTSFSASDLCKSEKHPLKVFDAEKRFFKCLNCQNRTVSLERFPIKPCKNCGDLKWQKTGMMKEKIVEVAHKLSIRGGEQKFINSNAINANLDLLVPDS